jgi:hypothetical protein
MRIMNRRRSFRSGPSSLGVASRTNAEVIWQVERRPVSPGEESWSIVEGSSPYSRAPLPHQA